MFKKITPIVKAITQRKLPSIRRGAQRGVAIIEGAVVISLVLLLLLGTMEMGRLWMGFNLLTHAVREGARLAVVTPNLQLDDVAVINRINTLLHSGGLADAAPCPGEVSIVTPPVPGERTVRVCARVDFTPVTAMIFGSTTPIPLRATALARHE